MAERKSPVHETAERFGIPVFTPKSLKGADAVPIQLGDVHSFENTSSQPLEFLIVGVSRDNTRRVDSVDVQGPRRAGN